MKILFALDLKEKYLNQVKETVPEAVMVKALDRESRKKEVADCQILVGLAADFEPDLLRESNRLRWIQSWSAGVDNLTRPEMLKLLIDNDIKLTTMSGVHSNIIAEHVMGYVISFSRKLYKFYRHQQRQQWQKVRVDQLEGRTMAVIGLGHIGREIAARARAFKMKTIGVKRDVGNGCAAVDHLYTADELLLALRQADYVVASLPLTDETSGLFSADEFRAMKSSAFFVNISRGKIVDEDVLIEALEEGQIAGAGLDVFEREPLPADSPLYKLDNVIITPHTAGIFPEYNQKAMMILLENLKRYRADQELLNLVDYNRGY